MLLCNDLLSIDNLNLMYELSFLKHVYNISNISIYSLRNLCEENPQFRQDHKNDCFYAAELKIKTTKQANIELVSSFIPLMYVRVHGARLININEIINYII